MSGFCIKALGDHLLQSLKLCYHLSLAKLGLDSRAMANCCINQSCGLPTLSDKLYGKTIVQGTCSNQPWPMHQCPISALLSPIKESIGQTPALWWGKLQLHLAKKTTATNGRKCCAWPGDAYAILNHHLSVQSLLAAQAIGGMCQGRSDTNIGYPVFTNASNSCAPPCSTWVWTSSLSDAWITNLTSMARFATSTTMCQTSEHSLATYLQAYFTTAVNCVHQVYMPSPWPRCELHLLASGLTLLPTIMLLCSDDAPWTLAASPSVFTVSIRLLLQPIHVPSCLPRFTTARLPSYILVR